MATINTVFLNALLADAAYVNGLTPNLSGKDLADIWAPRMTPALAKYIGDNFTVITQASFGGFTGSSFDITLWKDKVGKISQHGAFL